MLDELIWRLRARKLAAQFSITGREWHRDPGLQAAMLEVNFHGMGRKLGHDLVGFANAQGLIEKFEDHIIDTKTWRLEIVWLTRRELDELIAMAQGATAPPPPRSKQPPYTQANSDIPVQLVTPAKRADMERLRKALLDGLAGDDGQKRIGK
jgi:hypothetical protein